MGRVTYAYEINFFFFFFCENDIKVHYVLFGGEKKTTGKHVQTDFQKVHSEGHWSHRILL